MRVRYSKGAVTDLVAIADYIRDRNPRAAEEVEKRIRASIGQLEMFPLIGRPTEDPSIRMFPIVRYPYLVFYEVAGGQVVIHHIRHARREPLDPGDARSD
jgi:addiction module RelE/StbE family toxin